MKEEALSREEVRGMIESKLIHYFGVGPSEADENQIYRAVILTVKDILVQRRSVTHERVKEQHAKRVYYMCMEFLIGRSLRNNLFNLELTEQYRDVLKDMGWSLDDIMDREPDAALGNGGLGRLAACFMDAATSCGYPVMGYTILYEYGIFRQMIIDGEQVELPDNWLPLGDVWLVPRQDKVAKVRLGGRIKENWADGHCTITHTGYNEITAVPYDMMVSGYGNEAVNILRLWKAENRSSFNMKLFTQGEYARAMQENQNAEIISKVLYPSDNNDEGKLLRLTQQYFLVSASLQTIIHDHLAAYGTLSNLAQKVSIHLNDTHPALCIPELMRILIDTYSYGWDDAWDICRRVFTYTNHTVMPEALECWNEDLLRFHLPRIHAIIAEINRRFCADLWQLYPGDWDRISRMAVIGYNQVRMANLSVIGSNKVNGVSALHSDILKQTVFHEFWKYEPDKFTNVTNGIAHRRWLCEANPGLCALLDDTIGEGYRTDANLLSGFGRYADDAAVLDRLGKIKHENKERLAGYVKKKTGIVLDPDSVFDVHVKRMHEYKRQLLNILRILDIYSTLRDNPKADIRPQTFIFGAKAAPGYSMAKELIRLISAISAQIESEPAIKEKLRVIFMEDYNVSLAELLMPASEISEQISLAGKEASGTGNMKFMLNGALTVATLDGANVEMSEAVGRDNIFIFGLEADEVDELWRRGYDSSVYYGNSPRVRRAVDALRFNFNGRSFENIINYLLYSGGVSDPFMCLADFDAYCAVHDEVTALYSDSTEWNRKSLRNIAAAGRFAADNSIRKYADEIWHVRSVQ